MDDSSRLEVLRGRDLRSVQVLSVPGAHGVYLPPLTRTLLVTDITGGGVDDLNASRVFFGHLTAPKQTSTGIPGAHNIAATVFGRRIAVTHSGATSTKVSFYELRESLFGLPRLTRLGEVDAGLNPFGLATVY